VVDEVKAAGQPKPKLKLPRISTFAVNGQGFVVSPDFYKRAGPVVRRVNGVLDAAIATLVLIPMCAVVWLLWGARLEEPYVSDGVYACKPASVPSGDVAKAKTNGEINSRGAVRQ